MRRPKSEGDEKKHKSLRKKSSAVEDDGFTARRSTHVTGEEYSKADGDTWQETLAVCEMAGKLTIRSYYTNRRTRERKWDEPPSGASSVLNATETMRRMANVQLQEMQIATGFIKETYRAEDTKKKKSVIGSLFRRSKVQQNNKESKQTQGKPRSQVHYRPDRIMGKLKRDPKSDKHNEFDEHLDPAMQRALQSSLSSVPENRHGSVVIDADLERALSLSREEHQESCKTSNASANKPDRPDRPALKEEGVTDVESFQHDNFADDESVVLHEFFHSEEEALEMALQLSLMEAQNPSNPENKNSQVPSIDAKSLDNTKIEKEGKAQFTLAANSKPDQMNTGKTTCDEEGVEVSVEDVKISVLSYSKSTSSHSAAKQPLLAHEKVADTKKASSFDEETSFIFGGATSPPLHQEKIADPVQKKASRDLSIPDLDDNGAPSNENQLKDVLSDAHGLKREIKVSHRQNPQGKHRQRRRHTTKEGISDKEERMLQKALRASMKNATTPSSWDSEDKNLQQALKLSMNVSGSDPSSINTDGIEDEIKATKPNHSVVLTEGEIQQSTLESANIAGSHIPHQKVTDQRGKYRRLTPEEMAAKEEEMYQKALKASMEG